MKVENQKKGEIYPCQSFSNDIIFNSNNQSNKKCQKEELMNFSFKKNIDIKFNDITSNKKQNTKDLNIYSKNDKNIHKSGHFGNISNSKNKKKSKKLPNNHRNNLKKTLFNPNMIQNNNKENVNTNNMNHIYLNTTDGFREKFFEKIETKLKNIISNKLDKNKNNIQNRTTFLNKKLLNKINNSINKSSSKTNKFNKINGIRPYSNRPKVNNNIIIKKKILKSNGNKLFISSNTNPIFKTKNMKPRNNIRGGGNQNSFLNKSFDLTEKKITDSLFNKINHINKKISLFSEYSKKLKKQMKTLNEELSSYEINNSKKFIKSDKNNKSYKLITISPNKIKTAVQNSDIKNILSKRKIKTSNNARNNHILNKSKRNKNAESFKNITEFNLEDKKNSNRKNKKINNYKIFEKSIKKRRVRTDNLFECIKHINKIH